MVRNITDRRQQSFLFFYPAPGRKGFSLDSGAETRLLFAVPGVVRMKNQTECRLTGRIMPSFYPFTEATCPRELGVEDGGNQTAQTFASGAKQQLYSGAVTAL